MTTKEQIIEKRSSGLGSSDAKMVAKIGKNGFLTDADRFRIAVMLDLEDRKMFSTKATRLGNELEERIFEALHCRFKNIKSNPYYKSEVLSEKYGFDIFNHIDFEIEIDNEIVWIENKATIENITQTVEKYKYQLVWHHLLLDEKSEKGTLYLSHYDTSEFENTGFNAENLTLFIFPKHAYIAEKEQLLKGLEIISNEIKNGFQYEKKEELEADCLPEKVQNEIIQLSNVLKQIEEHEKTVENFKNKMLELMLKNGIKSIKNPFFNLTVVPKTVSTSFDSTRFKKEHPELSKQYQKQTTKKSYLIIKNHINN